MIRIIIHCDGDGCKHTLQSACGEYTTNVDINKDIKATIKTEHWRCVPSHIIGAYRDLCSDCLIKEGYI